MTSPTEEEAREARELVQRTVENWDKYDAIRPGFNFKDERTRMPDEILARYARELEERLRDCSLDLEAELRARYFHNGEECHAAMRSKFERDMEPVKCARALLGEKEG